MTIGNLVNHATIEENRIEYVETLDLGHILHSICAFANDIDNAGGGYIVIDVKEDHGNPVHPIKGILESSIQEILRRLRECCELIEPHYRPVVEPYLYEGVYLIVIYAFSGQARPYKAPVNTKKMSQKNYYIRRYGHSVVASEEEKDQLFYISSDIPSDNRPCLIAKIDDLSIDLMKAYLKAIRNLNYEDNSNMSVRNLANDLQLLDGSQENFRPKNVGILMFSHNPEKYFKYAHIKVVYRSSETDNNRIEKAFHGPIHHQLEQALMYVNNNCIEEVVMKVSDQAEAVRFYNYPFEAIKEVLAETVANNNYRMNAPITLCITPNSIEITSNRLFDCGMTDDNLNTDNFNAAITRNRKTSDYLKELKLMENDGFEKAKEVLLHNGSPEMKVDIDLEGDQLNIIFPIHPYFASKAPQLDPYAIKILELLSNHNMTLTELAKAMEYKGITVKQRRYVKDLIKAKQLKYVFSDGRSKFRLSIY